MPARRPPFTLPRGVGIGQIRSRSDRPIKNGRWYAAGEGWLAKVGWGDLSFDDLQLITQSLQPDQAFLALPEEPPGGQHLPFHPARTPTDQERPWCWYDRGDDPPGPDIATLADAAWYAVVGQVLFYVDQFSEANRLGYVWRERGYRYVGGGRAVSRGRVRLKAIAVEALTERLLRIVGDPEIRAVNALHR